MSSMMMINSLVAVVLAGAGMTAASLDNVPDFAALLYDHTGLAARTLAPLPSPLLSMVPKVATRGAQDVDPPRPEIPTQWTAPFQYHVESYQWNGTWAQDDVNKRYAYTFKIDKLPGREPINVPAGDGQIWSMVYNETGLYDVVNGVCRLPEGKGVGGYHDLFGWVSSPEAKYVGERTVEGRSCSLWELSPMLLCTDNHSNPVALEITKGQQVLFLFGEPLKRGPPSSSHFAVPDNCEPPFELCEISAKNPAKLDAVVFHPTNMLNIAGQDVADILGDTMFLCLAGPNATSAGQQYTQVSLWELEVWTAWGQYALCNGYPPTCIGGDNFHVGREASAGYKPRCGQCTDNSNDFGSWFSLGKNGECAEGHQPDGTTCTWRKVQRKKTVSITCPSFKTFFNACLQESSLPFKSSAAILGHIFNSDDIRNGGCPPAI